MQPFLFKEVEQLGALQRSLGSVFALYNDRRPELNDGLLRFLGDAAVVYRERGRQERECQVLSLEAELLTALRGTHPITLEKIAVRRHEMQNAIAFRILQSAEVQLRADLRQTMDTLQGAKDLLAQIVVAALQKGLITDTMIANATTQAAIEALWAAIAADADIALAQKRVLLMISRYDAFLLVDELLAGLR